MMKYLITLIMMLVFAVPVAAQVLEPGYSAVDTVAAVAVPVAAKSIKTERIRCDDHDSDKKTPGQIGYSKVVSIGGGSSNGVLGGGTVGIIRS